jgi:hypothetical protein
VGPTLTAFTRTFNEELLAAMLGEDVRASFPALCGLSFVRDTPAGARVHDLVREPVAADLSWRAPRACRDLRQRAYAYLAGRASSAADAGPLIQELLHLAAACAPLARFFAPADHPKVYVRPVRPDDLPRLIELCHTGITGFGFPPEERARQLMSDFSAAGQQSAVALDEAGAVTGFAYTLRLNRDTWRIAARTRPAFFDTLPGPEREAIETAPGTSRHAAVVAGPTYLPVHDHIKGAPKQRLFAQAFDHRTVQGNYVAYHLLTAGAPDLPEIPAAGHTHRTKDIPVGGCLADEWLIRFGQGGLIGWI